ncbi:MAG: hypothetical protein WCL54_08605, partial [Clostridia bacterium]
MKTKVKDTGNGFVEVTCGFKGIVNMNSFSWALAYDKTKVAPVTSETKVDAPNAKLASAAAIAPYLTLPDAARLAGYNISSFQIENTTDASSGNYVLIGYAKNTGATISLDGATEATMLKMTFRKLGAVDASTIGYFHKTLGGAAVSKVILGTTNVMQYATSTGATTFTRPDLFTMETLPTGNAVTLASLSATDLLNTGDAVYDAYMNAAGQTTVVAKRSYLATDILASCVVDPTTKIATLPPLAAGPYTLSVSRSGYMTRDIALTMAGSDLDLGDKSLIAGDVYADGIIDGSDSEAVFSTIGAGYGDAGYVQLNDINLDGIIDGTDSETIFANLGLDMSYYGETVDYYN